MKGNRKMMRTFVRSLIHPFLHRLLVYLFGVPSSRLASIRLTLDFCFLTDFLCSDLAMVGKSTERLVSYRFHNI